MQPIKYLYPIFTKTYLTGYCYFINIHEIFFIEIGSLCVKILFFDFNINKFYKFCHFHIYFQKLNLQLNYIYNFPSFTECNIDLPSMLLSPTLKIQKKNTPRKFLINQELKIFNLKLKNSWVFYENPLGFFIIVSSDVFISTLIFTIVFGCFHC